MTPADCEAVRIAAMALVDGETSSLTDEQIRQHAQTCTACRNELSCKTHELFPTGLGRPRLEVDLWPTIEGRLVTHSGTGVLRPRSLIAWRLAPAVRSHTFSVAHRNYGASATL